ncbi:MAG: hypothetical protein DRJ52_05365 [Thermoprotei archaeon]|nr:MAG: hypothetical protein DRJ52_05365 [Thermoprotei archaeon]
MEVERYKRKYSFGEDYGTRFYKFGPIREKPDIIENAGYFIEDSLIKRLYGIDKDLIVGPEYRDYLGTKEEVQRNLVYPMKDGIIAKEDERAWRVIYEVTKYGLTRYKLMESEFKGYCVTAALSAVAPNYMYEKIFEIHEKIDEETGLVRAVSVIPQPLAVAIANKETKCVVVESGHGNTQICPISLRAISDAIAVLNRGGAEADMITAEILRDAGYADLAREETVVRRIKEMIGLIPIDLDKAIKEAKSDPEKYKVSYRFPGTTIKIELEKEAWMRFLIGEIVFNPSHEIFASYYKRGFAIREGRLGDDILPGEIDLGEAIVRSVEKVSLEIQEEVYRKIILSGGNFMWKVPSGLEDVACGAPTKVRLLLKKFDIEAGVKLTVDPQYAVWKGCIVWSVAVPLDYEWSWEKREGWYKWR